MSVITNNLLLGEDGYNISRSVRLRVAASGNFSRTTASAGNLNKWTYSFWTKKAFIDGTTGATSVIGCTADANNFFYLRFSNGTSFNSRMRISGTDYETNWTPLYRDPSAWYHFVYVYDRQNATTADRQILYVNGVRQSTTATANPPTDSTSWNTNGRLHYIGYAPSNSDYYDGYLTEVNFIDGQALTPSSFGEADSITGVWKPKKYAGTYGTNGFYLNFSDPSAATAAAIGKDYSGNGNNWTPNNISVTSGVTYDSMLDVPTMWADGGNGRGNYAVLNPLYNTGLLGYLPTRNGNLNVYESSGDANWRSRWATIGMTSGKWYAEFPITYSGSSSVSSANAIGIGLHDGGSATYVGQTSTTYGYLANAVRYNNASSASYGATFANGDIISVAYDADAGTLTFYKNGTSQGVAYSSIPAGTYFFGVSAFWVSPDGNTNLYANFGQRPFAYTPPTGFKALNTQNLPDATIKKGGQYFDATTFTATGTTQAVTNTGFQPDFLWFKRRDTVSNHFAFNSVVGDDYYLVPNLTDAEATSATFLSSLNSNGFTMGTGNYANTSSVVCWNWKESVSAGFDIVTFTNPSSGSSSFAHSLGVKPSMIIVKARSNTSNWTCTHKSLGTNMADKWINLESTAAVQTSSNIWGGEPTSSVFYCGTGIQVASATMVAYLFAEVAGYSKFGSYTGNGSSDGPFVYLGFRAKYILIKRTDSSPFDWYVWDSVRNTYNLTNALLQPDSSAAEVVGTDYVLDILANGFKVRNNTAAGLNPSGGTMIYAAFAENPFKYSLGR